MHVIGARTGTKPRSSSAPHTWFPGFHFKTVTIGARTGTGGTYTHALPAKHKGICSSSRIALPENKEMVELGKNDLSFYNTPYALWHYRQ